MPIPADLPPVPAVPEFKPTGYGVRRFSMEADRATDVKRVSFTPCPSTDAAWGPTDTPEVASHDLVAELLAPPPVAPDTDPGKAAKDATMAAKQKAALTALAAMAPLVLAIADYLYSRRQ